MTTNTGVIFLTRGYPNGETNSNSAANEGLNKDTVSLGTELTTTVLDDGSNNDTFSPADYYPGAVTFDASQQKVYYVSYNENNGFVAQLFAVSATAATNTPATLYTALPQSEIDQGYTGLINDVVDDAATHTLYFTQVVLDGNGDSVASESGVYSIPESGGTATRIASAAYANVLAVDTAANLVFFTNSNGNSYNRGLGTAVNQLDVANLNTGPVTTLLTEPYVPDPVYGTDGYGGAVLGGIAVNAATHTLYYTTYNLSNTGQAGVYAANFTVTGSGSTASATLGAPTTLYSGTNSDNPSGIAIDPQNGVFYVVGNPLIGGMPINERIFEGSLTANNTTALTQVTPPKETDGGVETPGMVDTGEVVWDVAADVAPALTAGASVTYAAGGSAVATDAALTTSSVSSSSYTGATVVIGSPATGDTLSATTSGTAITASYSAGTLTLSGTDTVAHYQQVLDSVAFSSTASVPTPGARTLTYSVSDGITTSTATSTVTVHDAPTVTAGAFKSFVTGGAPVLVDPAGAVTAPSSSTLFSATISITGGFATGDTLAVGAPGGLTTAYNASTGVLTLSGTASAATYQTAIDSVTFSTSNISSTAARTLSYGVNDGVASSSTATSTVIVNFPPAVTAGASASFTAGGSPAAVDSTLTIADRSSTTLTGATVAIGAGFLSGDTLNYTSQYGITGSYNAGAGILTLSGTATLASYQTALDSVTYSFTPANGDPANGGADTSRTISFTVTDFAGDASTPATSTLTITHPTPVITGTQAGQTTTDQAAVMPFAGVTVSDSAGEQDSAAITLSAGGTATDADGALSGAGLTHTGAGAYTLAATDPGSLTTELQALAFTPTQNQVPAGQTVTTEFTLVLADTGGGSATDNTTTVVTTALCFCEGTRIMTGGRAAAVEDLAIGDLVATLDGTFEPIRWIGRRRYAGAFIAGRQMMLPVCVKAGALATGVPARDLYVSPGHGLFVGGQLVPAWRLINGASVVQAPAVEEVSYFHIELERHAILFAEGAPAESFLDEDFHVHFHNAPTYPPRRPDAPPVAPYAARLEDGFALQRLQRRIAARAGVHRRKQHPGRLRGFIDKATPRLVCGWLQDETQPEEPVAATILVGGRPVLSVLANRYRADLHAAGLGSGCHSFEAVLHHRWRGRVEVVRATDGAAVDWTGDDADRGATAAA